MLCRYLGVTYHHSDDDADDDIHFDDGSDDCGYFWGPQAPQVLKSYI